MVGQAHDQPGKDAIDLLVATMTRIEDGPMLRNEIASGD